MLHTTRRFTALTIVLMLIMQTLVPFGALAQGETTVEGVLTSDLRHAVEFVDAEGQKIESVTVADGTDVTSVADQAALKFATRLLAAMEDTESDPAAMASAITWVSKNSVQLSSITAPTTFTASMGIMTMEAGGEHPLDNIIAGTSMGGFQAKYDGVDIRNLPSNTTIDLSKRLELSFDYNIGAGTVIDPTATYYFDLPVQLIRATGAHEKLTTTSGVDMGMAWIEAASGSNPPRFCVQFTEAAANAAINAQVDFGYKCWQHMNIEWILEQVEETNTVIINLGDGNISLPWTFDEWPTLNEKSLRASNVIYDEVTGKVTGVRLTWLIRIKPAMIADGAAIARETVLKDIFNNPKYEALNGVYLHQEYIEGSLKLGTGPWPSETNGQLITPVPTVAYIPNEENQIGITFTVPGFTSSDLYVIYETKIVDEMLLKAFKGEYEDKMVGYSNDASLYRPDAEGTLINEVKGVQVTDLNNVIEKNFDEMEPIISDGALTGYRVSWIVEIMGGAFLEKLPAGTKIVDTLQAGAELYGIEYMNGAYQLTTNSASTLYYTVEMSSGQQVVSIVLKDGGPITADNGNHKFKITADYPASLFENDATVKNNRAIPAWHSITRLSAKTPRSPMAWPTKRARSRGSSPSIHTWST